MKHNNKISVSIFYPGDHKNEDNKNEITNRDPVAHKHMSRIVISGGKTEAEDIEKSINTYADSVDDLISDCANSRLEGDSNEEILRKSILLAMKDMFVKSVRFYKDTSSDELFKNEFVEQGFQIIEHVLKQIIQKLKCNQYYANMIRNNSKHMFSAIDLSNTHAEFAFITCIDHVIDMFAESDK